MSFARALPLVLLLQASVVAQESKRGESVRVLFTGRPGLHAALDQLGLRGHHVHRSGAADQESAECVFERREFRSIKAQLPAGTLSVILEESRPFREIAAAMTGPDNPDPGYHTRAEVIADLQAFEANYPSLAKVYDLTSRYGAPLSHDGYAIYALRISNAPDVDQDKPNIALTANTHAGELAVIEVPLFAADKLLTSYGTDPALTQLVNENQIWILPNLNPDGLEYTWSTNNFWRKNRRDNGDGTFGVDMNRNYPSFWSQCGSSTSTGSSTYHGPFPASEPEVRAKLMFAEAEGLERILDFHCTGPDVRYPFNPLVESRIPQPIRDTFDPLQAAVANAMNYTVRGTCCCGTLMEWHFSTKGSMTFLVEFAACRGPFSGVQAELDRAWPGIREFLLAPVPLRGHVTSANGGAPLVADLTIVGNEYQDGQTIQSGGPFGAYHFWGGPGTYDVRFSAPDHVSQTISVNLTAGSTVVQDVVLPFGPSATHRTFGAGCPGSGPLPSSCISRNGAGGTLSSSSSTNEYAYEVQSNAANTVTGFRLFTESITGGNVSVAAHVYRADASGEPESSPVATGTLNVGSPAAFWEVSITPPLNVAAGETFFIAADTTDAFASNLASGEAGRAYWRRPPRSGNWATSSRVQAPAWEVICAGGGQPGAIPQLTARGVPSVGGSYDVELSDAARDAATILLLGTQNMRIGPFTLPLSLDALGAPGCLLLSPGEFQRSATTNAAGDASVTFGVPGDPALVGVSIFEQFAIFDPPANALGISLSNAGEGRIGF